MDHLMSADDSADMEIVNSWLNWTMSLSQLLNHNDNASPVAMLGVAILIAVVSFAVWKKCCAQARHTATVQIPPAQPVLQQPMAQPQSQIE